MTKKCACGQTAWFGNYCHECRDRAIKAVSAGRRCVDQPIAITTQSRTGMAHSEFRKPMSEIAARKHGSDK